MSPPLLIADSGPLIALARLDLLALPRHFFAEVLVTPTVWAEVTRRPKPDEMERLDLAMSSGVLRLSASRSAPPDSVPDVLRRAGIDAGERVSILLALEMEAALLLDDKRARLAAHALGLPVLGTLGLLARGRQTGAVGPLRPLCERLADTGYYLPAEALSKVLSDQGE